LAARNVPCDKGSGAAWEIIGCMNSYPEELRYKWLLNNNRTTTDKQVRIMTFMTFSLWTSMRKIGTA
jgi:hypothetical protein